MAPPIPTAPPGCPALSSLALPEPSRRQLFFWAVWMSAASVLLAMNAVRAATRIDLFQWWVPIVFVAGIAAADFLSGIVHWAADTWGRADLPVIGPRLLVPFRVHHLNPDDFLRRTFLDANGDVAAVTIPPLIGLWVMPIDVGWAQALAVSGLGCCALGMMTNQIHQWAHMPIPPPAVRLLQRAGLFLRPADHAAHHDRPFDAHYCITTGWCNGPLEMVGFFRRLESVVTRVTGCQPREDERRSDGRVHMAGHG